MLIARRNLMISNSIPHEPVVAHRLYVEKENYYLANGVETPYNGWSISNYIEVSGKKFLVISTGILTETGVYSCFYDEDKKYIGNAVLNNGIAIIPDGAKFFRYSNSRKYVVSCAYVLVDEIVD